MNQSHAYLCNTVQFDFEWLFWAIWGTLRHSLPRVNSESCFPSLPKSPPYIRSFDDDVLYWLIFTLCSYDALHCISFGFGFVQTDLLPAGRVPNQVLSTRRKRRHRDSMPRVQAGTWQSRLTSARRRVKIRQFFLEQRGRNAYAWRQRQRCILLVVVVAVAAAAAAAATLPLPSLNTLGSFAFELCSGKTDRQTDGLERSTHRVSVRNNDNTIATEMFLMTRNEAKLQNTPVLKLIDHAVIHYYVN